MTNAFATVSKTMWAFLALLVIIAGLGGYVLGEHKTSSTTQAGSQETNAIDNTAAEQNAALAKLVEPGSGGTAGSGPKTIADGSYDAMVLGPGGKLESKEDIYNVHRRSATDPFAIGAIDAPVVISEFSDFECPFCSRFVNQTEPTIINDYVNKGLVRMEWNDLAINGPNAEAAARAGRAAAAQGKFMEFKHALYTASKDKNGHPAFTEPDFERFAEDAGVPDMDRFRSDATSDKYSSAVEQARTYATSLGINGTPGFVIGGQFISGAQPTEVFINAINAELAKVRIGEVSIPEAAKQAAQA